MNSGSWWWTGRPGMLRFMGLQRVGHDWAAELNRSKRWAGMSSACRRLTNKDSTKRCLPQRLWDSRRTLKWLLWYYNGLLKISFTVSQSCRILVKLEEQCSQLFCGKAIHWVICWCQKWKLMGTIFNIVPAIQKVFICLVSSLLMNIFSIVLFLTRWGLGSRTDWGGTSIVVSG